MAGIGQVSPIQHVDNKQPVKGLQELFGLTMPLFFLTLALLSLALSLAVCSSDCNFHPKMPIRLKPDTISVQDLQKPKHQP
jgi:hypothetical protein